MHLLFLLRSGGWGRLSASASTRAYGHTYTHTYTHTHTHVYKYLFSPSLSAYPARCSSPGTALSVSCNIRHTTVQGLKAVNIKTAVIYSVAPCILVHGYQLFGASRALSHRGRRGPYALHKYFVSKYQNIRRHIPEACNRSRF